MRLHSSQCQFGIREVGILHDDIGGRPYIGPFSANLKSARISLFKYNSRLIGTTEKSAIPAVRTGDRLTEPYGSGEAVVKLDVYGLRWRMVARTKE